MSTKKKSPKPSKAMAKRLKRARMGAGLSQVKLAEKTGIDNTILCRFERGDRRPNEDHVKAISKATKTKLAWLLTGKE